MVAVIMLITQMAHQQFPAIYHLLSIIIWCRCCTPVQVICDALYPITNNITVFVLGQPSQLLFHSYNKFIANMAINSATI